MRSTMRELCIRGEGLAVRLTLRALDRVGGPLIRRRRLAPHIALIVESTEAGADYATATALARRLLQQRQVAGGPRSLRALQKAARTHGGTRPAAG